MMTAKEREKVSVGGWETVFGFFSSCAGWSRRTLTEGDVVVVNHTFRVVVVVVISSSCAQCARVCSSKEKKKNYVGFFFVTLKAGLLHVPLSLLTASTTAATHATVHSRSKSLIFLLFYFVASNMEWNERGGGGDLERSEFNRLLGQKRVKLLEQELSWAEGEEKLAERKSSLSGTTPESATCCWNYSATSFFFVLFFVSFFLLFHFFIIVITILFVMLPQTWIDIYFLFRKYYSLSSVFFFFFCLVLFFLLLWTLWKWGSSEIVFFFLLSLPLLAPCHTNGRVLNHARSWNRRSTSKLFLFPWWMIQAHSSSSSSSPSWSQSLLVFFLWAHPANARSLRVG